MNLAEFLNSLSIEGAGELTFNLIMEEGFDSIEKINSMGLDQIANVGKLNKKTIGEKTAWRLSKSLHSEHIQELLPYSTLWVKEDIIEDLKDSELRIDVRGKKLLFTGDGPFPRIVLTAILKRNGAIIQSSVTKDTEILVLADRNSSSNKANKARKYGIKMMLYSDVFRE
jgi:NAD-dependent DNA ligase